MPRISLGETNSTPNPSDADVAAPKPDNPPAPESEVDAELRAKSGGKLADFLAFPDGVDFQGEEEGETVILLLRKHVITNVPWILATFLAALVPIFIFPFIFMSGLFPPLSVGFRLVLTLLWYMGTITYAFLNFLYWYFNVFIITNERVVDVDWFSLIYRRVYSAQFSKVQDVGSIMGGVIRSIFDFGNVHIETAGAEENIEFEDVPHPALVAKKIESLLQVEEAQWEEHP